MEIEDIEDFYDNYFLQPPKSFRQEDTSSLFGSGSDIFVMEPMKPTPFLNTPRISNSPQRPHHNR